MAVDGVSLTVAALAPGTFEIMLIPHTSRPRRWPGSGPGSAVNIEVDVIGKYLQRALALRGIA